jgi:hypothetical protein
MNQKTWAAVVATFALSFLAGCQSGGIGDPCVPEDEYQQFFSGYSETEVNLESRSFQCETRLCLVNHFRGRVSCPYGQPDPMMDPRPEHQKCHVPGTSGAENHIKVPVNEQYSKRSPANSVYCSCRCAGVDPEGRYCKCPTGFQCVNLLDYVERLGSKELAGSYCVKDGTEFEHGKTDPGERCTVLNPNAEIDEAPGDCGFFNGPI